MRSNNNWGQHRQTNHGLLVFAWLMCLVFVGFIAAKGIAAIEFNRSCGGYLRRAADANTIELARNNLNTAVSYLRANNLTSGYTSVLYTTPDEDIGFWFSNLESSLKELESISPEATPLEQSNVLLKLRETILHNTEYGERVTAPDGISVYPNNALFGLWGILSFSLMIVCFVYYFITES